MGESYSLVSILWLMPPAIRRYRLRLVSAAFLKVGFNLF